MKHFLKRFIILGIAVLSFTSCNQKQYFAFEDVRVVKTFPVTYELCSPEVLNLDVIGVQGIKVLSDYIIVSGSNDKGCLSIFSKTDKMHVADFLNIGNGPGEVLYTPFISWIHFSHDERCAYIYDFKGNYLEYDLSVAVADTIPLWNCIAKELPMMDASRYFYVDNDRLLCRRCKLDRNGYERFIVDCNGDIINSPNVGYLNMITSSDMNLLSTGFAINNTNNRIAEFGSRINVIHLYSYVDDFAITLSIGDKMTRLDDWEQLSEGEMRKMYYDSKSFNKFFAALYLGTTLDDLDSGTFDTPRIHIFDWEGNPIGEIAIPVRTLFFDIDITDKQLYVVEYETDHILKYDISEICDKLSDTLII